MAATFTSCTCPARWSATPFVKGLKLPDGPPHDLGQVYILIDPDTHSDQFGAIADRVAAAVAEDTGARIPGARARGRARSARRSRSCATCT